MCFPKKHFHYLQMSCVALLSFKISIYEYGIIFAAPECVCWARRACRSSKESPVSESKVKSSQLLSLDFDNELLLHLDHRNCQVHATTKTGNVKPMYELKLLARRTFLLIADKYLATVALTLLAGSALFFFSALSSWEKHLTHFQS